MTFTKPRLPCLALELALFACSVGAASPALAQADPTRPAPAWLALQPPAPGQAPVEVASEGATANTQIMVSSGKRQFVVVDGTVVHLGETLNGAKLVGIRDSGPVWQKGGVRETPSMTAGVEKTPVRQAGTPARKDQKK